MTCNACGEKPKNTANGFTKAVIEINNPETLVLLRKVVIPTSMGTEEQVPAAIGKYHNVILYYEANKHVYLYSSDGIPTLLEVNIPQELWDRIDALEEGLDDEEEARSTEDTRLQQEIDDLKNSPDVVDIVATYADLQAYDTSELGDKDVVRVLTDETHDDESSYYRWSATTQTWTFIGATGPYYTKDETDALLDDKQDTLTAGDGIDITSDIIKATNTGKAKVLTEADYNWNSTTNSATEPFDSVAVWRLPSGIYRVEKSTIKVFFNKETHNNMTGTTAMVLRGSDGNNGGINVIYVTGAPNKTYTTYVFTNDTTWVPATYLLSRNDVFQTGGNSQDSVISQRGATSIVYPNPQNRKDIKIGFNARVMSGAEDSNAITLGAQSKVTAPRTIAIGGGDDEMYYTSANGAGSIAFGYNSTANGIEGVAIGEESESQNTGAVAIGAYSHANIVGEMNVGSTDTNYGYNNTNYRLVTGVHDPQNAHDAATKGYVDGNAGKIRMLTTADYNWNSTTHTTDNPDCVAIWLLPSGAYYVDNENAVYYCQTASYGRQSQANTMFFVSAPTNAQRGMIVELSNTQTFCKIYSGITVAGVPSTTLPLSTIIIDNLTNPANDAALSAAQGVYLKGMIGDLAALTTTDKSSTVAAINEVISGLTPVVQTTGVSTTDVMSQNATTSMAYSDPATKYHIVLGDGASNTGGGDGSVAIGRNAHANGDTVSIGTDSGNVLALANNQINIGHGAGNEASHERSISIGDYSKADYIGAIAIGSSPNTSGNTKATKMSAVAIGVAAVTNGERSVALGNGAFVDSNGTRSIALEGQCFARGSVALGAGSTANTEGTVDVGAAWHMNNQTWGYLGSDYRRITGVYDGQALHDAATLAQANTLSDSAPTTSTVGVLGQLYTDTTNMHTYQCTYIDDSDPDNPPIYTWTQRW